MFTGLVQAVGRVARMDRDPRGVVIEIDPGGWAHGAGEGGSIAVNGCCLTLTVDPGEIGGRLRFFAIPETLAKTNLGGLGVGSGVDLEGSVTAQTLMGGHFVQGHVDGVGEVVRVDKPETADGEYRVRVSPPAHLMKFMAPKGSVCLDGVSLTIAALEAGDGSGAGGWIEVALIPATLEKTIMSGYEPGDAVNIEADILAKTVVNYLENYQALGTGH
ncbi:MAG: riboflavin synthase [Phycisphaeraceae bacterium]|nr:MAG: riboflavin synthase [Phycisphaeraceae bacterium]